MGDKRCANCKYWIKTYQECSYLDRRQDESGAYMSPPDKYCDLWERNKIEVMLFV